MSRRSRAYIFNQRFPLFSETIKRIIPPVDDPLPQSHDFHGFNHPLDNGDPILPSEEKKEMNTPLNQNQDGTYTLTLSQIEDLSNGKIKVINGRLYLDASQIISGPATFTGKNEFIYEISHPVFNLPSDSEKDRIARKYPETEQVDVGYKPTFNMIDAKTHENLGPLNPSAEDLVPRPVDTNYVVEDPTYLSLELEGMENTPIKELELILRELHHNTGNDRVASFEQFAQHAGMLYGEYRSHVRMLDQDDFDPEFTKWTIAIHLQDTYWESFRGRTITILKLFNKLYNPDDKLYYLETPITGMKKR